MMLSVPASPAASQVELLSASVSGVAPTGHRVLVNHNGRSVVVRVNDRCSYGLDLSLAAAQAIGLTEVGIAVVDVEVLVNRSGADTINKHRGLGSYWGLTSRKYRTRGRGALNAERPPPSRINLSAVTLEGEVPPTVPANNLAE